MKELIVESKNPKALDETLQQIGGLVGQNPDGSYHMDVDGYYTVRAMGAELNFLAFSMAHQGYGKVIGEREI